MEIAHTIKFQVSAESVFKAVSTQNGVNGWWAKEGMVAEEVGKPSKLIFNKQGRLVEMGFETTALEENALVEWLCTENANPAWHGTKITYRISVSNEGCTLNFCHSNFDPKWNSHETFEMTKGGWQHFMNSLKKYCETGIGEPW